MKTLTYVYGTMTSGKTTQLLSEAHNLRLHGKRIYLLTASIDSRSGVGMIRSRIGISSEAETYVAGEDLFAKILVEHLAKPIERVMVDEAQWLSRDQVWQLSDIVDELGIGVTCYGLRSDFRGDLFEGSAALMSLADEMRENTGVCATGEKATMVARMDGAGNATTEGPQVLVGGEETYAAMSRKAWKAAIAKGKERRETRAPVLRLV